MKRIIAIAIITLLYTTATEAAEVGTASLTQGVEVALIQEGSTTVTTVVIEVKRFVVYTSTISSILSSLNLEPLSPPIIKITSKRDFYLQGVSGIMFKIDGGETHILQPFRCTKGDKIFVSSYVDKDDCGVPGWFDEYHIKDAIKAIPSGIYTIHEVADNGFYRVKNNNKDEQEYWISDEGRFSVVTETTEKKGYFPKGYYPIHLFTLKKKE